MRPKLAAEQSLLECLKASLSDLESVRLVSPDDPQLIELKTDIRNAIAGLEPAIAVPVNGTVTEILEMRDRTREMRKQALEMRKRARFFIESARRYVRMHSRHSTR